MEQKETERSLPRVLIVRHGNTFDKGDVATRVGRRTDLPLSRSGRAQALRLGEYLTEYYPPFDEAFSGTLKRARETASLVLSRFSERPEVTVTSDFDEIDYGPDENRTEPEVIARVGKEAIEAWNSDCIPAQGWHADPEQITGMWQDFLDKIAVSVSVKTAMVVTSSGIARFAPFCLADFEGFREKNSLKLATCGFGEFLLRDGDWHCKTWNRRAPDADARTV